MGRTAVDNGVENNAPEILLQVDDVTIDSPPLQPDGGWGWVVCVSCFLVNGVIFGTMNCFGVLYIKLRDEYGKDDPNISFKTAWVGSVCIGLTHFFSLVTAVISDVIGLRKTALIGAIVALAGTTGSAFVENLMLLYFTFGVLTGSGFSLVMGPHFVIIGHYFKRHLSLVSGITVTGGAVFTSALSLAIPELLDTVGVRNSFLALSALVAVLIPSTITWRAVFPTKATQMLDKSGSDRMGRHWQAKAGGGAGAGAAASHHGQCHSCPRLINGELCQNRNYVLWIVSFGICTVGYFVPFVHLIKYANDVFPKDNGNVLIMCLAGSAGICRLAVGKLSQFWRFDLIRVQLVAFTVYGVCTLCIPFAQSYQGLVAVVVVLGICDGAATCLMAPIAFDLVEEFNVPQAMGLLLTVMAGPVTAGPPLAGLVYDKLGTYSVAFHVAGCFPIIGALLMLFIKRPQRTMYEGIQFNHLVCDDDN